MALSAMSSTHRCLGLCGKRGLSVSKYVLGTNQGVGSSKRASATTSRCQVPTLNQTAVTSEGMGILKCSQTSILQRAKVVCSAAFEAPVVSPDGDSSQRNLEQEALVMLQACETYEELQQILAGIQELSQQEPSFLELAAVALTQKMPELEAAWWSAADNMSATEVEESFRQRLQIMSQLRSLSQASFSQLPLQAVAECADVVAQHSEMYDNEFFGEAVEQVLARSQQHTASNSNGRSSQQQPAEPRIPAHLACSQEELPQVLQQILNALSAAGYYSPAVLQLLAQEIVASISIFHAGTIAALIMTFAELQHYHRGMLNAMGMHLLRPCTHPDLVDPSNKTPPPNISLLTPLGACYIATAFAFFNVNNPAFYQVLLARMSAANLDDLNFLQAADMYMAANMVPQGVAIPARLQELLSDAAKRDQEEAEEQVSLQQMSIVTEDDEDLSMERLIESESYDIMCARQLLAVITSCGLLPQGEQIGIYVSSSEDAPWMHVPLLVPCQTPDGNITPVHIMMFQNDNDYCRNVNGRLRGSRQIRLRVLQNLGCAVWPLNVEVWQEQVEDAAGSVGLPEDYWEVSMLWAESRRDKGRMEAGQQRVVDEDTTLLIEAMCKDLSDFVSTCLQGTAMLKQQKQVPASGAPAK